MGSRLIWLRRDKIPASAPDRYSQFVGHRALKTIAKDQMILTTELSPEANDTLEDSGASLSYEPVAQGRR
jgi:hypothetical protein